MSLVHTTGAEFCERYACLTAVPGPNSCCAPFKGGEVSIHALIATLANVLSVSANLTAKAQISQMKADNNLLLVLLLYITDGLFLQRWVVHQPVCLCRHVL